MNATELKIKYPESVEMIDGVESKDEVYYIRGNKTVHKGNEGTYYYNYTGTHYRVFPSLEMMIKWFYGNEAEQAEAEATIVEYMYSSHLSNIKGSCEVNLDVDGNVAFCDFSNSDFTEEELNTARAEN